MSLLLLIQKAPSSNESSQRIVRDFNLELKHSTRDEWGFQCDYFDADNIQIEDVFKIREAMAVFYADVLFVDSLIIKEKKSMFVFDMDSTLIKQEVIDEIARKVGVYDSVARVTQEAMEGNIDFNESLKRRCEHLAEAPETVFDELYEELQTNEGVDGLLSRLNDMGVVTCVLSGGFDKILSRFARDKGFQYHFANHLEVLNGKLTGRVVGEIVNKEKKKDLLLKIQQEELVDPNQCVAVGDGANDALMLNASGKGIGFHAKAGLKKNILNWIEYSPMTSLLFLFQF